MIIHALSLYVTILELNTLNKILTTSITSLLAVIVLIMAIPNPAVASLEEEEDDSGGDNYDPRNDYTRAECAEMFPPEYDYSRFQTCTGDIGWPNPGP